MKFYVLLFTLFCCCTSSNVTNYPNGLKVVTVLKGKKIFKTMYFNKNGVKTQENFNYILGDFTQSRVYNDFGNLIEENRFDKVEFDTILVGKDSMFGSVSLKRKIISQPSYEQKKFYKKNKIKSIGYYIRAKKDGVFSYFDSTGRKKLEEYYRMDSLIKKINY